MTGETITRRAVFTGLTAAGTAALLTPAPSQVLAQRRPSKPPLAFSWSPDKASAGSVVIIVSLSEQRVHVYRGGVEIGTSPCSSGKPGHRTPTGVFTILEKAKKHESSLYKGAQMPNMERLTWGGVALHAGNLPGYPASHGCVRLPLEFSAKLFEVTHIGTVVIIADERTQPASVVHPGALLPRVAEVEAQAIHKSVAERKSHDPWDATVRYPVTSVVVSRADGKAYIFRDGKAEAAYPAAFRNPAKPLGMHTYTLIGPDAASGHLHWLAFGVGKKPTDAHIIDWQGDGVLRRIVFRSPERALQIARTFHPGTTLVVTDAPATPSTRRTPKGFSVIASEPT
jgi:hypothetical protein